MEEWQGPDRIYIHLVRISQIPALNPTSRVDGEREATCAFVISIRAVCRPENQPRSRLLLFASKGTGTAALIRTV